MRELTIEEQAILKNGADAEALLTNPSMASAINEFSEGLANALLSTSLDQSVKREQFYHLHTALKELVAILSARVNAKKTLEATLEAEKENE